jgi:hypothetical protein
VLFLSFRITIYFLHFPFVSVQRSGSFPRILSQAPDGQLLCIVQACH